MMWENVEKSVLAMGKARKNVILFLNGDGTVGFSNPGIAVIEEIKLWRWDWMDLTQPVSRPAFNTPALVV
ncbi:MAG: hypothetical protein A3A86_07480 [Elusimicrobia bacterium RIFCSPLOWO2_01_FULL_60_11]|nr:MAG: hypothetical protein A3A86_07480 [Elusimicrobia bacterium RIFCSPLOWO2_01_FULL_60_11]